MKALSEGALLPKIIEAYSRPTRIVRGKDVTDDLEVPFALRKLFMPLPTENPILLLFL